VAIVVVHGQPNLVIFYLSAPYLNGTCDTSMMHRASVNDLRP
jgi:hypothetical protein